MQTNWLGNDVDDVKNLQSEMTEEGKKEFLSQPERRMKSLKQLHTS